MCGKYRGCVRSVDHEQAVTRVGGCLCTVVSYIEDRGTMEEIIMFVRLLDYCFVRRIEMTLVLGRCGCRVAIAILGRLPRNVGQPTFLGISCHLWSYPPLGLVHALVPYNHYAFPI